MLSVVINALDVEQVAKNLARIDARELGAASLRAVNLVAQRGFDESVDRMTSRINWSKAYVTDRMGVEPANDLNKPEAKIIAFRGGSGSRRPALRATTLRQFAPRQEMTPVRHPNSNARGRQWRMKDGRMAAQKMRNPRAPEKRLPFILRTGAPHLGIPVGQKAAGISVEITKGKRVLIPYAFMAPARRGNVAGGQGLLVFSRSREDRKGKGRMRTEYRPSVWSVFRNTAAVVLPSVREDLERSINAEVAKYMRKVLP